MNKETQVQEDNCLTSSQDWAGVRTQSPSIMMCNSPMLVYGGTAWLNVGFGVG